jgi:hypothetical protein
MFSKLFGSNKKDEEKEQDNELDNKIDAEIKKTEQGKREAENAVKTVLSLAQDVIIDTYADFFPNAQFSYYRDQYKQTALEKYEEIKKEHASKVDPSFVQKCDKILAGYLNQAKMLETKVEFFSKLSNEYQTTKQKLVAVKQRAAKLDKYEKHDKKLQEMNQDTDGLAQTIKAQIDLEDITKDFELKQEYYNQVEILKQQYGTDTSYDNSLAYKDEIDKIMGQLK